MRTNVYVDGFNLYYGCLKGTPYRWLDLDALCRRLLPAPQHSIQRIRYFTAKVGARPNKQHDPVHQSTYLRALATLPCVTTHLGHFLTSTTRMPLANPLVGGPQTVEVVKTEEKGSDVNLATYLLADAFRDDAEAFAIISNDSDLTEPLRIVRHELGKVVGLLNPHPPAKRSRAGELQADVLQADPCGCAGRQPVPVTAHRRRGNHHEAGGLVGKAKAPP